MRINKFIAALLLAPAISLAGGGYNQPGHDVDVTVNSNNTRVNNSVRTEDNSITKHRSAGAATGPKLSRIISMLSRLNTVVREILITAALAMFMLGGVILMLKEGNLVAALALLEELQGHLQ